MKTILTIFTLGVMFVAVFASAQGNKPTTIMGEVTYGSLGTNKLEGTPAEFYGSFLEGNIINSGAVSMVAKGKSAERAKRLREEYNNLNGGRGSYVQKIDAQGNKFWGYDKMDAAKVLQPEYKIDVNIDETVARHSEDSSLHDISVTARIYNAKTGELAGQSTEVRRNVNPYANERIVGHQPSWFEKYISGYARETKYDDPIREAIDKASNKTLNQLAEMSGQKIQSDADRFTGYLPIVPPELLNPPAAEKTDSAVPEPGRSVSKNNYNYILNSPGCKNWVVKPETGVFCFTEEEQQAITNSGSLGGIFIKPPTYPFYDGNEPWQAPTENPPEPPPAKDEPVDDYAPPPPSPEDAPHCKRAANGTCIPDVLWTVPR